MGTGAGVDPPPNLAARAADERERLLARLTELCEAHAPPPGAAAKVETVMLALLGEARRDVRARFAERAASAHWPSARLIETLAGDDIEVARPVIGASPRLGDQALIRLVADGSPAHRLEIARRPRLSAEVLAALIERGEPAVLAALAGDSVLRLASAPAPAASEIKLVDKLAAAGGLQTGWLVRVLKDRKLGLFEAGLAKLGAFLIEDVRRAVNDPGRPELLALACAGVGLDRSVFPVVLDMVRQLSGGRPGGGDASARRAAEAFGLFGPRAAARAFRIAAARFDNDAGARA